MKQKNNIPGIVNNISELHRKLKLPRPEHPLISVLNVNDLDYSMEFKPKPHYYNFYMVCVKKGVNGTMKYGQNNYDFSAGIISFISPKQVIDDIAVAEEGWLLMIHSDFLRGYSLAKEINSYGFFSYAVNEALHVSEREELEIEKIMQNISQEYQAPIDSYSQDIMISQIELLLNYSNRFYNRQFITRKHVNNDLLNQLDTLLRSYFQSQSARKNGLPTVAHVADQLHLSPNYLSDMLRQLTGRSTQQHIHDQLITRAKNELISTSRTISEIAYQLGFKQPQSFSKLFTNKTNTTPTEFRSSFN